MSFFLLWKMPLFSTLGPNGPSQYLVVRPFPAGSPGRRAQTEHPDKSAAWPFPRGTIACLCGLRFVNRVNTRRKNDMILAQSIERRNSLRFQIALPLLLRWDGPNHYGSGHCVNISEGGLFVLAAKCPAVGIEIEVELVLPAFGRVPRPTRLRCVGRVSRVETCCQLKGFAITGKFVNELQTEPVTCGSAID